ncbi:hypothetical protein KUV50_00060 [Membranicola marinus]|uniref:Glycosyl hydrolases family 32 N-terminal domain-containing protein n=1 Tax=Membranihabitans marinus TaxID=1227546 RepID=A0A953HU62_9BACT|nr:hypothetical protein [Membranihabitans marinus]MBY5956506.1 hypothetical protein [Membranihabitans marinus]
MNRLYPVLLLQIITLLTVTAQEPLQIQDDRQLFVDHYLIDAMDNTELRLHHPVPEGAVLHFDKPWEGHFSGYSTIIKDGPLFKAYYRGVREAGSDGRDGETTCIALSTDGIHWTKPELGLFEVNGSKKNNIVLAHAAPVTHNFSPFIDQNPACKPEEKYKGVGGTSKSGLIAYSSPDGIHWTKMQEEPVFTTGVFDSQNVVFWSESENQYVCYFRTWSDGGFTEYKGFRTVSRTTSKDFIHWTDPVKMTFGGTPPEHLYTQQTSPYYRAPQIYLAIGARFMPGRQVLSTAQAEALDVNPKYFKDCSDAFIMSTRGGDRYDRTFMESYIRPEIGLQNWVSRSNYPALNVVETGDTEMSLYVNENYAQPTAHLKRYSMRIDGFASLHAGYGSGTLVTKPLVFTGKELEINYSTSAAGSVRVEIQDEQGQPIPGFGLRDCQEIIGNELDRVVTWQENSNVQDLAGRTVRLKIRLKDADLYAFKFNE